MALMLAWIITFIISFTVWVYLARKGNTFIIKRIGMFLFGIMVVIVCFTTYRLLNFIMYAYYNNQEFTLDSSTKYIIYRDIAGQQDKIFYYEVDFEKNNIVYREDNEDTNRKYKGTILKEYNDSIKKVIENVISNEENLVEISQEEKPNYYNKSIYAFYSIKTYNGEVYYVRDTTQIKQLDELLGNYQNKIQNLKF